MISIVKGVIESIELGQIEIKLKHLGISLSLMVPNANKFKIDDEITFFTYMHWNQEQGPSLFGFEDKAQKRLFIAMIACSGIGPKMGIGILEQLGMHDFVNAIKQQDIKLLSTVSGIGSKKAEQIIVQLKHKIDKLIEQPEFSIIAGTEHISEVRSVLSSLNYSTSEVSKAIDYIKQDSLGKKDSFDAALRRALSFLSKNV